MECPSKSGQGPELFIAYAAHTLPVASAAALERHCEACSECRVSLLAQKTVWDALDAWEPQHISSTFDRKLYARIAAEDRLPLLQRIFKRDWSFRPAIPVGAVCAIVLAGYLLRTPPSDPAVAAHAAIENRVDIEQVERALDDFDMLKQMGVSVPAPDASEPEPI